VSLALVRSRCPRISSGDDSPRLRSFSIAPYNRDALRGIETYVISRSTCRRSARSSCALVVRARSLPLVNGVQGPRRGGRALGAKRSGIRPKNFAQHPTTARSPDDEVLSTRRPMFGQPRNYFCSAAGKKGPRWDARNTRGAGAAEERGQQVLYTRDRPRARRIEENRLSSLEVRPAA